MCGIVYSKSLNGRPVNATISKRFEAQKHRGTSGFGFYIPQTNKLTHNIRENRILSLLKREKKAEEILFHHRFPTSTANVRTGCHPYSTKDYFENSYVIVHNGVVGNAYELEKEHKKLGIKYVSKQESGAFNDSEALAFDLARYFEGQVDKLSASGSIAFIAVKNNEDGKPIGIFFGRNLGNPLKMKRTEFSLTISSEGEGDLVPANELHFFNYETGELTKRDMTIPGYSSRPSYGQNGYGNYGPYQSPAVRSKVSVTDKPSYKNGWDNDDDLAAIQASWEAGSDVNLVKEGLLEDSNNELSEAIVLAQIEIDAIRKRLQVVDDLSADPKLKALITDDQINDYCEKEDQVTLLEGALKELREDLSKEVADQTSMGFHYTPKTGAVVPSRTGVETGVVHKVPTRTTSGKTKRPRGTSKRNKQARRNKGAAK